jgi:hypothetical protein
LGPGVQVESERERIPSCRAALRSTRSSPNCVIDFLYYYQLLIVLT